MEDSYPPSENSWGQRNKIVIIGSVAVIFFILIITTLLVVSRSRQSANSTNPPSGTGSNSTVNNILITPTAPRKIYPNPKIDIKSWIDPAQPQNVPISGNIYALKQNFATSEVKTLATQLGANQTFRENQNKVLSYTINKNDNNISIMTFDKASGSLSYSSTFGLPLSADKDLPGKVYELLTNLNLYDPTIQITATYKQKDNPNLTYVELHRDWNKVGMPILNAPGLLNLPENQLLSNLTLLSKPDINEENSQIYSTSDNKDGLARQTDFNTITLAIYESNNTLYSLHSNIRILQKTTPDVTSLTNYAELLKQLKAGKYNFFMASPTGNGVVTWDKIFPNNKASTNQAVITEAIYAYVEAPPKVAQTKLEPSIIFRGYSILDNGYRVNWVASINATEQKSLTQRLFNLIKPVEAQAANACTIVTAPSNIPQDDYCPSPNQVYTRNSVRYCCSAGATPDTNKTPQQGDANSNTTPGPTVPQTAVPTSPAGCKPNVNTAGDWVAFVKVNNTMILGLSYYQAGYRNKDDGDTLRTDITYWKLERPIWYYIPQQENLSRAQFQSDIQFLQDNAGNIEKALRAAVPGVNFIFFIKDELRSVERALQDFDDAKQIVGPGCPIRVTGGSPSIFVYGEEGKKVTISPQTSLLYADPPIAKGGWNVSIHNNQLVVNGLARNYLYYEYQPIAFEKPSLGWIIEKDTINKLALQIGKSLKLNSQETQRLEFELQYATTTVTNSKLFVGLVDQNEVNQKLPLHISPQPEKLYRYHFYVGEADQKEQVKAPTLKAMERSEFMIVEFGSYTGK